MSTFGSPGGQQKHFKPTPPQKGSFPLDHYAECKQSMQTYLSCIKRTGGSNDQCRHEAKDYLACRMQHNLMAQESMRNLGFADDDAAAGTAGGNKVVGGVVGKNGSVGNKKDSGGTTAEG